MKEKIAAFLRRLGTGGRNMGTYECNDCGQTWDGSEIKPSKQCPGCGGTLRQISNMPKAYWQEVDVL